MSERTHLLDHARPQAAAKVAPTPPPKQWRWSVKVEINEGLQADYDMHGETIAEILERASHRGEVVSIVRKKR